MSNHNQTTLEQSAIADGNVGASPRSLLNQPPTVTVQTPNGGEVYQAGQAVTISWESFDFTATSSATTCVFPPMAASASATSRPT